MKRRSFLEKAGTLGFLIGSNTFSLKAFSGPEITKLTILHTNDVHSRIEPFPMNGGRFQGLGGAAKRASLIREIRAKEQNVLLLDSGDIFQGTPYFNYFEGELEFKLMSAMEYDAATIGNHDFDAGIDGLFKQLPNADFPFLICNYDFSDTIMNGQTKLYKIFEKADIRIGVFGLGIKLEGMVPVHQFGNTQYLDPIENGNKIAEILKHEEKCDLVICLSHLGYKYEDDRVSDIVLAKNSKNIDLILGGHTHTFMDQPDKYFNLERKDVLINQVGWAGMVLGRIDIFFERNFKNRCSTCNNVLVKGKN
jgi:5'-nucleotidase